MKTKAKTREKRRPDKFVILGIVFMSISVVFMVSVSVPIGAAFIAIGAAYIAIGISRQKKREEMHGSKRKTH